MSQLFCYFDVPRSPDCPFYLYLNLKQPSYLYYLLLKMQILDIRETVAFCQKKKVLTFRSKVLSFFVIEFPWLLGGYWSRLNMINCCARTRQNELICQVRWQATDKESRKLKFCITGRKSRAPTTNAVDANRRMSIWIWNSFIHKWLLVFSPICCQPVDTTTGNGSRLRNYIVRLN